MAEVRLGKADGGRTIDVNVGDRLVIELEENPTTGYRWAEAFDARPIAVLRAGHFEPATTDRREAREHRVGAGGVRRFEYDIEQGGTLRVELRNQQNWGDRPTAEAFTVTIVVQDGP